jgi:hypothetical protein
MVARVRLDVLRRQLHRTCAFCVSESVRIFDFVVRVCLTSVIIHMLCFMVVVMVVFFVLLATGR